jgi:hypothetical protein
VERERFINIRKLAALDIVYRGERTIMLEFGFGVFFLFILGIVFLLFAHHRTPFTTVVGIYLLFLGLYYIPLLAYSLSMSAKKSAQQEVAFELAHQDVYRRKYGIQQMLILVPLSIIVLVIVQESIKGPPNSVSGETLVDPRQPESPPPAATAQVSGEPFERLARSAFDSLNHLFPFRMSTGHVASSRMLGEKTLSSL